MNDQKEFAQLLAYLTGSKSEQELETAITTIGEEGLKKLAAQYEQLKSAYNEVEQKKVMDEMKLTCEEYLTKKAKFGAKLNYIQALKNRCPEGTQLYKVGGRVECKKCGGSTKVKPTGKTRFAEGGESTTEWQKLPEGGTSIQGHNVISQSYSNGKNYITRYIVERVGLPNDTLYFDDSTPHIYKEYKADSKDHGPQSIELGITKDQNKAKARFKEIETKVAKKKK